MKNKRKIIFIMTCIIFMMSHSSILETKNFKNELNIFIKENNLSHEELNEIIGRLNKIGNLNKKELKTELEKIGKFKSTKNPNIFYLIKNSDFELIYKKIYVIYGILDERENKFIFDKIMKNNLRIRE